MYTRWSNVASSAPEFAASVAARFGANLHHLLGTIRADGSPRISGTEVTIGSDVGLGMMPDSRKLADVGRDPRVEIHSAPLEEDLAAGDAKIGGRLVAAGAPPKGAPGSMFVVDIERVSLVQVDGDELVVSVWHPGSGLQVTRRR
ncbi:MAG: hypothetical protein RIE08_11925 [Acidimicrobiales bacterium]